MRRDRPTKSSEMLAQPGFRNQPALSFVKTRPLSKSSSYADILTQRLPEQPRVSSIDDNVKEELYNTGWSRRPGAPLLHGNEKRSNARAHVAGPQLSGDVSGTQCRKRRPYTKNNKQEFHTCLGNGIIGAMTKLLLLFISVPLLEMALLIEIGGRIGTLNTVGLIVLTGILGAALARRQGLGVLRQMQAETAEGRLPAGSIGDGVLILLAAACSSPRES